MNHKRSMRDEDIRQVLWDTLSKEFQNDPDSLVIEELGLCQGKVRVDLAVINGSIHGYEIKSERDTLDRLPAQKAVYCQTLNRVTVVTAERHLEKLEQQVPEWWGLSTAELIDGRLEIDVIRKTNENPEVDPSAVVQLLWRNEALDILSELGIDKGMRSKPRDILWNRLVKNVPLDKLQEIVRRKVKARGDWRSKSLNRSSDQPGVSDLLTHKGQMMVG